jgi:hypothetical protein
MEMTIALDTLSACEVWTLVLRLREEILRRKPAGTHTDGVLKKTSSIAHDSSFEFSEGMASRERAEFAAGKAHAHQQRPDVSRDTER